MLAEYPFGDFSLDRGFVQIQHGQVFQISEVNQSLVRDSTAAEVQSLQVFQPGEGGGASIGDLRPRQENVLD